jgi:hypothetical protein
MPAAVARLLHQQPGFTQAFAREKLFYLKQPQQIEMYMRGLGWRGLGRVDWSESAFNVVPREHVRTGADMLKPIHAFSISYGKSVRYIAYSEACATGYSRKPAAAGFLPINAKGSAEYAPAYRPKQAPALSVAALSSVQQE